MSRVSRQAVGRRCGSSDSTSNSCGERGLRHDDGLLDACSRPSSLTCSFECRRLTMRASLLNAGGDAPRLAATAAVAKARTPRHRLRSEQEDHSRRPYRAQAQRPGERIFRRLLQTRIEKSPSNTAAAAQSAMLPRPNASFARQLTPFGMHRNQPCAERAAPVKKTAYPAWHPDCAHTHRHHLQKESSMAEFRSWTRTGALACLTYCARCVRVAWSAHHAQCPVESTPDQSMGRGAEWAYPLQRKAR